MMKRLPLVTFGLFLLATVAASAETAAAPVNARTVVYVADFELKATQIPQSIPKPVPLSDRVGYGSPKLPPTPEQRARELVDLMSRSLLDDLRQASIPAQRLPPGAPLPSSGWIVRGAFLEIDPGGGLREAVIGGGSAQIEVVAAVDQLRAVAPQPLYTIDTTTQGGKFPDAIVTLNPNMPLGRFMLARVDLDRNVRDVAAEIADQVKIRTAIGPSGQSGTK